jgi:TPR repeat protein
MLMLVIIFSKLFGVTINELTVQAEQGNSEAQEQLGLKYYRGDGTDFNPQEGFYWLKKSADNYRSQVFYWFRYNTRFLESFRVL